MAIGLTTKPLVFHPTHALDVLWGHPLAQGIVGGWMFQEGAGRRVANIVPDALPGTFVANDSVTYPTWTLFHRPQYGGRAIQNQTQSYVSVGNYGLLNPTRITVHAWFYRTSTTSGEPGVTKRHLGNNSNNFFLGTGSSPNGMFSFIAYTVATTLTAESSTNFTTNEWHQVVGTYDGSNARLWVDRANTATAAGSGILNGNAFPNLVIGSDFQVAGYWNGRIASVVIWNRALSSAEIVELYTNPHAFLAPPSTRRYFITSMGQAFTKLFTETVTLTDTLVKQPGKVLNETATLTDMAIRSAAKVLSDAMTLSDVLAKLTTKAALTEAITLSDMLIRGTTKSLNESMTLSDALARLTGKAFSDGVSLSDVLAKLTGKTFADSVTLTDTLIKQLIFVKLLTETITLTDTLVREARKVLPETITLTDAIAKSVMQHALSEVITLTDTLAKQAQKALAETPTLTDGVARSNAKVLSEVIALSDATAKQASKVLVDSLTLSDILVKSPQKLLSDLLALTDAIAKLTGKPFTETIALTDSLVSALTSIIGYIKATGAGLASPTGSSASQTPTRGAGAAQTPAGGSGANVNP